VRYIAQKIENWINPGNNSQANDSPRQNYQKSQDALHQIEVIDVEAIDLENKERYDGSLSRIDQERKEELEFERQRNFQDYQALKKKEVVEQKLQDLDGYETSSLDNDKVHILQYHMGQVVLEKHCYCGRPMILNSKRRHDGSLFQLNDFFWSCTGYYNQPPNQCRQTANFTAQDAGLLHKNNVFEFQVSNQDLSLIFNDNKVKKMVVDRVRTHKSSKDDEVLCPIHHIPMVMREKQNPEGALDMFFLACSHPSCGQISKLKSPAQLAAFLSRKEGRGIL
jgi:hypothetical protein